MNAIETMRVGEPGEQYPAVDLAIFMGRVESLKNSGDESGQKKKKKKGK